MSAVGFPCSFASPSALPFALPLSVVHEGTSAALQHLSTSGHLHSRAYCRSMLPSCRDLAILSDSAFVRLEGWSTATAGQGR